MTGLRRVLAMGLLLALASLQVGLPVLAQFEARPARFGWHMYSTINPAPQAWIEDQEGNLRPVDLHGRIADQRAEIRWAEPLAVNLCTSDAAAIVVADREGTTRVACP